MAIVFLTAVMGTVHVDVVCSEQAPPNHLVKVEPAEGVAIRVTVVPLGKLAAQVGPQSIPSGSEVIVPEPVPDL